MAKKVGYLGPEGTFSEEAAWKYLNGAEGGAAVACRSLSVLVEAVERGELDEGIVPLENSCEGSVSQTMDLLAGDTALKIRGEIILPVCQNLMARPGVRKEELLGILSHPQPLAQCRGFIEQFFPGVRTLEASSTAEAARQVAGMEERWGAIGTARAAEIYGLEILAPGVNDGDGNATRFLVLGPEDRPREGKGKTSIIVSVTDRPGALYRVLKEFALYNISLTRIESRPARRKLGEYIFFIDFQGSRLEPEVAAALKAVGEQAAGMKNLGSYPADAAYQAQERESRLGSLTIEEIRSDIDVIDFQIIELLGKRTELVSHLAGLKKGVDQVRDPAREQKVLNRVRDIAVKKGFAPDVTEEIYRILFGHFVDLQKGRLGRGK